MFPSPLMSMDFPRLPSFPLLPSSIPFFCVGFVFSICLLRLVLISVFFLILPLLTSLFSHFGAHGRIPTRFASLSSSLSLYSCTWLLSPPCLRLQCNSKTPLLPIRPLLTCASLVRSHPSPLVSSTLHPPYSANVPFLRRLQPSTHSPYASHCSWVSSSLCGVRDNLPTVHHNLPAELVWSSPNSHFDA